MSKKTCLALVGPIASTSSWRSWLGLADESPEVALLVKAPFTGRPGGVQLGSPGAPSPLSPQERWPVMDAAQDAMRLEADEILASNAYRVPFGCLSTDSLLPAVLRRRSALHMERATLPQEAFLRILAACACVAQSQVDLLLMVHDVEGLAPGLYLLARSTMELGELLVALPGGELRRLEVAEVRHAAQLSACNQDIAGGNSFGRLSLQVLSVAMACYGMLPQYCSGQLAHT